MLVEDFIQLLRFEKSPARGKKSLYRNLSDSIQSAVHSGRISPGAQLPASRYLAQALSVSRSTIINAYEQLIAEGIAESKPGDGTYIKSNLRTEKASGARVDNSLAVLSNRGVSFTKLDTLLDAENHSLFLPGLTDLSRFPDRYWKTLTNRYAHRHLGTSLSQQHLGGYQPLRESIVKHLRVSRNIECEADQILIHNGLQQAASLIFNLLCDRNDTLMVEDPGYPGIKSAALMAGLSIKDLALDSSGATIPNDPAKIVYVTPSHQFPMGINMTLNRRKEFVEFARSNNTWIIEDDYDTEFPLGSKPIPALKGLDTSERIIYSGTFSKVLANYIRVSYLVVPHQIKNAMRQAAKHFALEVPFVLQATIADYISEGYFYRHIRNMRAIYSEKQSFISKLITKEFKGIGQLHGGESGLHMTIEIDKRLDDKKICREASKYAMGCRPLSEFCSTDTRRGVVLGFGYGNSTQIENAIKRLSTIVQQHLKRVDV